MFGGPPKKKSPLPWIIAAIVVVLVAGGVVLSFALRGGDSSTAATNTSSTSAGSTSSGAGGIELPGGATRPSAADETSGGSGEGEFDGSEDVALEWVNALFDGDSATAYGLLCAGFQQELATTATTSGTTPEQALADLFLDTLGGVGIDSGDLVELAHDEVSDMDVATFDLTLQDGSDFMLLVGIDEDLTVCDFA